MKNLCKISVTSSPVQALNKLKRANIPVYNCKKQGACFTFEVYDNYIKKVFAIFAHPCYNVTIKQKSVQKRLLSALLARPCLVLGALMFTAAAIAANSFVFKISVTGSGSYLKNDVLSIAYSSGATTCGLYKGVDSPTLCARVMALPDVTFCSVHKSGSVLYIDVQVQTQSGEKASYSSLAADVSGTVSKVVAVCGTPLVTIGDSVTRGDVLIGAYYYRGEEKTECMAAGYVQLTCSASISLFYKEAAAQNSQSALAAALLYAADDEILTRTVTEKTVADGAVYTVDFTYLHTISINFS